MTERETNRLDAKDLVVVRHWGQKVEERSLQSFATEVSRLPTGKALWEGLEHL